MVIAFLMDELIRPRIISPRAMQRFEALGEVLLNHAEQATAENVKPLLARADVAVTSWGCPAFDEALLAAAPNLKLVLHAAGSVKSIVTDAFYARGLRIVSSARALSWGVSETALGLTIASLKNLFALNESVHAGQWAHENITELFEITIGVVGFGFAGRHYAELLRPFDVDVVAYDPNVSAASMAQVGARKAELDELLKTSDLVSLHAPSIPSTHHMINRDTLALMKPGAVLINTARGALVDEAALYDALKSQKLKCACLDVTDPEPPAADCPLRTLSNCVMTPHLAGQAANGMMKIGAHCVQELNRYLTGEPLQTEVTQAMLATIA